MAWTDIDFNLIIPGMITKGPALVSFGDYLNEFSTALDERWNIVSHTENTQPTLFDIVFEVGEIRTGAENSFWDRLRELIGGYSSLWFSHEYYDRGVLTDVLNDSSYLISDAELQTAIGVEAYDILVNYATLSNQEIFKASIFQAFFTIYEKTAIIVKAITRDNNSADIHYNQPIVYNDASRWFWSSDILISEEFSSYSALTSAYASRSSGTEGTLGASDDIISIGIKNQIKGFTGGDGVWLLDDAQWADFIQINYLSKDLQGSILTMEYVPSKVNVFANFVDDDTDGSQDDRQYTSQYTYSKFASIDNVLSTDHYEITQDPTFGTIMKCSYTGNEGDALPVLAVPNDTSNAADSGDTGNCEFGLSLESPGQLFIDLNNSALEFYIA